MSGEWDFPPARAGAPGRKAYRRGSIQGLGADPNEVVRARAEYEGDKFVKSAVETVRYRLSWWRQRAVEHHVEPYPLTVEKLQLFGSLLKRAGYRSAAAYMSAVKNQHVRLGHPWSDALGLELRDGKRACERGIGLPVKCGAFDMQKLAELRLTSEPVRPDGPMLPGEGTLCGCWWAMLEVELSTAWCMQVSFRSGRGCGLCIFDLPVSKADPQALGKKRTHSCTCETNEVLCPVKVARNLHGAALRHSPAGAHPLPGMRPLWPSAQGKFVSKRAATRTFQKLASLAGVDSRITGHMCRVTGAQAMAVAGVDLWLIQAFCRWGYGAVLEYVRDCQLSAAVEVSAQVSKGVQIKEVRESMYQQVEDTMGPRWVSQK